MLNRWEERMFNFKLLPGTKCSLRRSSESWEQTLEKSGTPPYVLCCNLIESLIFFGFEIIFCNIFVPSFRLIFSCSIKVDLFLFTYP